MDQVYLAPWNGKWWDGYMGQDVIVFYDSNVSPSDLEQLLGADHVPLPTIHGGMTWAAWTKVYIINKLHPTQIYPIEKYPNIMRRITKIIQNSVD